MQFETTSWAGQAGLDLAIIRQWKNAQHSNSSSIIITHNCAQLHHSCIVHLKSVHNSTLRAAICVQALWIVIAVVRVVTSQDKPIK